MTARADEQDLKTTRNPTHLTIRPTPGNGAIINLSASGGIFGRVVVLTVEERRIVAKALWPDAFTGDDR